MLTREDLQRLKNLNYRLENLKERRERIASLCTGKAIEYSKVKVQTSSNRRQELLMAMLADIDTEIEKETLKLSRLQKEVLNWSNDFPIFPRTIIRLRYIRGLNWEEISEYTAYSVRHVQRIHNDIISKIK